jgi:hypothetical protein
MLFCQKQPILMHEQETSDPCHVVHLQQQPAASSLITHQLNSYLTTTCGSINTR